MISTTVYYHIIQYDALKIKIVTVLNIYVTQSDKKGLIAGKYMHSLNNMYLTFSIR